jgi:hypothetical protein
MLRHRGHPLRLSLSSFACGHRATPCRPGARDKTASALQGWTRRQTPEYAGAENRSAAQQRTRGDLADYIAGPSAPRGRVNQVQARHRARDATKGLSVTRLADGGWVQLSKDGKIIRGHPIRHDRSRELGAFANPKGRPRRKNSATGNVA